MKFPTVNICLAIAALMGAAAPARAQLGLPRLQLPQQIGPLDADRLRRPVDQLLDRAPLPDLAALRLDTVRGLLRRHPDLLEADPRGEPAVRGEILAWSPGAAALDAAAQAGLRIAREEALPALGERLVVLRVPAGMATAPLPVYTWLKS